MGTRTDTGTGKPTDRRPAFQFRIVWISADHNLRLKQKETNQKKGNIKHQAQTDRPTDGALCACKAAVPVPIFRQLTVKTSGKERQNKHNNMWPF